MSEKRRCKTCKHFEQFDPPESKIDYGFEPDKFDNGFGECEAMKLEDYDQADRMVATFGYDGIVPPAVGSEFGCIHWEPSN